MPEVLQEPITGSDLTYTSQTHLANPTRVALDASLISGGNSIGQVEVIQGTRGPLQLDASTYATNTIDYSHHEIHDGSHYNIRGFSQLDTGDSLVFGFTTPNTAEWPHLLFEITGTSQTEVRGFEGATLSGNNVVIPINNNRNSTKTCSCVITSQPVVSGTTPTSGTLIEAHSQGQVGATPSQTSQAGTADRENEWILKSGTTYMWELLSLDDANIIDYAASWYEHTDKEQVV